MPLSFRHRAVFVYCFVSSFGNPRKTEALLNAECRTQNGVRASPSPELQKNYYLIFIIFYLISHVDFISHSFRRSVGNSLDRSDRFHLALRKGQDRSLQLTVKLI